MRADSSKQEGECSSSTGLSDGSVPSGPADAASTIPFANEEWRTVPGYETAYEVSSRGRIRTVPRMVKPGNRNGWMSRSGFVKPQLVEQQGGGQPILTTVFVLDGLRFTTTVARVVYTAFHHPVHDSERVLHRDGNSLNCEASNLYTLRKGL